MKTLIILSSSAVLIGTLACSQAKPSAAAQPQAGVPTATEVFHLRSECAALGEKLLSDKQYAFIGLAPVEVSHYNPATNRCYVVVNFSGVGPHYRRFLYDGQTGEYLGGMAGTQEENQFIDNARADDRKQ
jgi:hypothetical protein